MLKKLRFLFLLTTLIVALTAVQANAANQAKINCYQTTQKQPGITKAVYQSVYENKEQLFSSYHLSYYNNHFYLPARVIGDILGGNYKWYKEGLFTIAGNNVFTSISPKTNKIYIKNSHIQYNAPFKTVLTKKGLYFPLTTLNIFGYKYTKTGSVFNVYTSAWRQVYEKELDAFTKKASPTLLNKPNIVSTFSTRFYAGYTNRTTNLALAAKALDGVVLDPGEVFSFNKTVGQRTPEAGYKKAIIFVNKKKVEDYGGGVCQVSSTLYNAVYKADLKVLQRKSHSLDVTYVPKGMDATVSYGFIDFVFKNIKPYALQIQSAVKKSMLTIELVKYNAKK